VFHSFLTPNIIYELNRFVLTGNIINQSLNLKTINPRRMENNLLHSASKFIECELFSFLFNMPLK